MEDTARLRFEREFYLDSSPKALYPFLITDYGLGRWFADKVTISAERGYVFYWQQQPHHARLVTRRQFKYLRYEFDQEEGEGAATLEFTIDTNELTQETYLRVVDCTSLSDESELDQLWENLISNLRELLAEA